MPWGKLNNTYITATQGQLYNVAQFRCRDHSLEGRGWWESGLALSTSGASLLPATRGKRAGGIGLLSLAHIIVWQMRDGNTTHAYVLEPAHAHPFTEVRSTVLLRWGTWPAFPSVVPHCLLDCLINKIIEFILDKYLIIFQERYMILTFLYSLEYISENIIKWKDY